MENDFIIYLGTDIKEKDLEGHLSKYVHDYSNLMTIRSSFADKCTFVNIVREDFYDDGQPHIRNERICSFKGSYDRLYTIRSRYSRKIDDLTEDSDSLAEIILDIYNKFGSEIFSSLYSSMPYVLALCDMKDDKLIISRGNDADIWGEKQIPIYYGITENGKLMFGTKRCFLEKYCTNIKELENGQCYYNGEFISFKGLLEKEKNFNLQKTMVEPDSDMLKEVIKSFTAQLFNVSSENVAIRMKAVIDEELKKIDITSVADKTFREKLILELSKRVIQEFKQEVSETKFVEKAMEKAEEKIQAKVEEYVSSMSLPKVNIIRLNGNLSEHQVDGVFHQKFEDILKIVSLDEALMLIGPAGSGKNVAIEQVSKALGLSMYYTNNANNEFKITGFVDAGGNYRARPFYKAFKDGGVFFLDEIDNSDPSALIVLNSALANGYMDFPHETVTRHKDFRMVAAANTWGKGSDLHYVGRSALDASTLDRFDTIFFDYDRKMESTLYPNEALLQYMWAFRDSVQASRILHIISTRGIGKAYKKLINDIPTELVLTSTILKGLSEDDINIILGKMESVSDDNEFMHKTKVLNKVLIPTRPTPNNSNQSSYTDDDDSLPF